MTTETQGAIPAALLERFARIRLFAMDVDGTLTDGRIGYDSAGNEFKTFFASDGLGLSCLQLLGVQTAWITGRSSSVVARRANELKVGTVLQGVQDKRVALSELMEALGLVSEQVAYVGDDWNDLPAFQVAGLRIAVANAAPEVCALADFVTPRPGGGGGIRDVCDLLLEAQLGRDQKLERYLESLRSVAPG